MARQGGLRLMAVVLLQGPALAKGAKDCGKAGADLREMERELKVYAIDR